MFQRVNLVIYEPHLRLGHIIRKYHNTRLMLNVLYKKMIVCHCWCFTVKHTLKTHKTGSLKSHFWILPAASCTLPYLLYYHKTSQWTVIRKVLLLVVLLTVIIIDITTLILIRNVKNVNYQYFYQLQRWTVHQTWYDLPPLPDEKSKLYLLSAS